MRDMADEQEAARERSRELDAALELGRQRAAELAAIQQQIAADRESDRERADELERLYAAREVAREAREAARQRARELAPTLEAALQPAGELDAPRQRAAPVAHPPSPPGSAAHLSIDLEAGAADRAQVDAPNDRAAAANTWSIPLSTADDEVAPGNNRFDLVGPGTPELLHCPVCLRLRSGQIVVTLPCSHGVTCVWCMRDIASAAQQRGLSPACPICGGPVARVLRVFSEHARVALAARRFVLESHVRALKEMGFPEDKCEEALIDNNLSVEQAMDWLLSSQQQQEELQRVQAQQQAAAGSSRQHALQVQQQPPQHQHQPPQPPQQPQPQQQQPQWLHSQGLQQPLPQQM